MAYRISYDSVGNYRSSHRKKWRGTLAVALVVLLVIGAICIKTSGLTWVQEVLLPGDPAVTAVALEGMITDLRNGDSLYEAVKAFCQEIIEHAGNPQ